MYQDAARDAHRKLISQRSIQPADLQQATYNDVLQWATNQTLLELIDRRDSRNGKGLPSLQWAGARLVTDTNRCLAQWCEARGDKRGASIKTPLARQAAEVMSIYSHVILVPSAGEGARDTALLSVWDESENLYVECSGKTNVLTQGLRELCFTADDRWISETISCVRDLAEMREPSMETHPDWVPLLDCVYNVTTKERLPYTPAMVYFAKVRTRLPLVKPALPRFQNEDGSWWDPESWLVETLQSESLARCMKEAFNYCLRPRAFTDDKIICLMSEEGSNGKGTVLEFFRGTIGGDKGIGCVSLGLEKYSGEAAKYSMSGLIGAMANLADESDTQNFIATSSLLKAVSSHDPITLERKYRDAVSVRIYIGQIFSLNKLPRFKEKSKALERRLHLIDFPLAFKDAAKNDQIKEKYVRAQEVREWLLWEALVEIGPIKSLSTPSAVQDTLERHRGDNDSVVEFWRVYQEPLENSCMTKVPLKMLYDAYSAWSRSERGSGSAVEGVKAFTSRLVVEAESSGVWTVERVARGDIKQTSIKGWRGTPSAQAAREIFGDLGKSEVRPPTTYTPHQEVMAGDKQIARWTRGPAHLNEIAAAGTTPERSACLERDSAPAPAATSAPATPTPQAQAPAPAPARAGLAALAAQAGVTVSEAAPIHPVTPVGVAPGWGGEGITPPVTV